MKIILRVWVLLFIVSCTGNSEINNGYLLAEEPEFGDKIIISREDTSFYRYVGSNNEKKILQKGVILKYHSFEGNIETVYSWKNGDVIGSCVVKYGINDTFIIVEQKSLDDIFGKLKSVGSVLIRDRKPTNITEMKRMLKNCNSSKYWIINKKTDDIYGPYKLEEYIQKRKELGVSKNLILNENKNVLY